MKYRIVSVEKTFRLTPWEHVTHIVCCEQDGITCQMSYHDAIRCVEEQKAHFYVIWEENRIELELACNALGYKCLRAAEGDRKMDILLALPDHRDKERQ